MEKINFAKSPPPEELIIDGASYPIKYDFLVWIEALELFEELIPNPEGADEQALNIETIVRLEEMIFGRVLNAPWQDVIFSLITFAKGYPAEEGEKGHATDRSEDFCPLYSFSYDINYIIIAIRNQSGIDLSFGRKLPFHWWLFLLEFQSLAGEHRILELISYMVEKDNASRKQRAKL